MPRNSVAFSILLITLLSGAALADYQSGVAAYNAKNWDEAITEFQALIENLKVAGVEEDPQYAAYYVMLGRSFYGSGKLEESVPAFKTALKLKGNDVSLQLQIGQAYYHMDAYADAAATLSKVNLSSLPRSTQGIVFNMLSVCYDKLGRDGLALRNMERAAQLNPKDAAAQFNYGTHALSAGYTDDAVKALDKAVALDGRDPAKRRALVSALLRKGRETPNRAAKKTAYEKGALHAQQLARMKPTYDNLLQLGEAQLGAQQHQAAIGTFDQAIAKNPRGWHPYFYKGQAYTVLGDFGKAIAPLDLALGKGPPANDKLRIHKQLGFVYEKLKNFSAAMQAYKAAGDSRAFTRVQENDRIAKDNQDIDAHNTEIADLERKKKELEEKLKAFPGGAAPPR